VLVTDNDKNDVTPISPDDGDQDQHDYQIEQIIPAPEDWVTVWEGDLVRPIVCMALIECLTHGNRFVAPMVSEEDEIVDATQIDGYFGMVSEDDLLSEPEDPPKDPSSH
jgi:hypothetical protein